MTRTDSVYMWRPNVFEEHAVGAVGVKAAQTNTENKSVCDWCVSHSYPDEPAVSASGCSGAGQQNWCSTVSLLWKGRRERRRRWARGEGGKRRGGQNWKDSMSFSCYWPLLVVCLVSIFLLMFTLSPTSQKILKRLSSDSSGLFPRILFTIWHWSRGKYPM